MKMNKMIYKSFLAFGVVSLINTAHYAKTIDVSKANKDIKVMTRILETNLENSEKDFPGRPIIKGTYLAEQGYLFNIQLSGIGSFGIPGVALWGDGQLQLDIPEIVTDALSGLDINDSNILAPAIDSIDSLHEDDELQEQLRNLREKQREMRRNVYEMSRQIRKTEDKVEREKLEKERDKTRENLKLSSKEYTKALNSYKSQKKQRKVQSSNVAINAIFTTVCDYGQTLKALKKNEKVTLMIKGGVDKEGNNATQVYVMEQQSVKKCSDSMKLKNNAINYSL